MIHRLQKRFIAVTMLAVFLVLVILIGAVNIVNYRSIGRRSDTVIETIVENRGMYPVPRPRGGEWHHDKKEENKNPNDHWDSRYELDRGDPPSMFERWRYFLHPGEWKEMPYEVRYFAIYLDNQTNKLLEINSEKIHSVLEEQAIKMAKQLAKGRKTKGYYNNFRFRVVTEGRVTMVVCLERTRELSNFYTFLTISITLSVVALLLVWLLVYLFSKRAVRPIAESYEKQKEFITNAGHELKTPLAIIQSCTDVVEMENGESKWTGGIHEQVDRLSKMTEELVTLSRMDESAMNIDKRKLNFSELAVKTLEPFTLMAEDQGKKLQLDIAPNVLMKGNERTLKQLCSVLADNAVKYSRPHSEIRIALQKKGHRVYFGTDNEAEGLKKGSYNHLFDRFYRGDTSHNTETGGYGIGLSMAQSIVQGHGGKITAVSRTGEKLEILAVMPDDL